MKPRHLPAIALALLVALSACAPALAEGRPFRITATGGLTIA